MQPSSTMHKSIWNKQTFKNIVCANPVQVYTWTFSDTNLSCSEMLTGAIAVFHSPHCLSWKLGSRWACLVFDLPWRMCHRPVHNHGCAVAYPPTLRCCLRVLLLPQFLYYLQDIVLLLLRLLRTPKISCPTAIVFVVSVFLNREQKNASAEAAVYWIFHVLLDNLSSTVMIH